MTCYNPLQAYYGKKTKEGKNQIVWKKTDSWKGEKLLLPCSKCIGCRERRAQEWAMRCEHEASQYVENSYITLTYKPGNLPPNSSLHKPDMQNFLKRLRKQTHPKKIRYFYSGEYGDIKKTHAPHYHAIIFNHQFADLIPLKQINKNWLYTSTELEKLWPQGYHSIGQVNYATAAYVAQYVHKKQEKTEFDKEFYQRNKLVPEYTQASLKPAIGTNWLKKYQTDVYPSDEIIQNGHRKPVPRIYDIMLDRTDPELLKTIKKARKNRPLQMVTDKDQFGNTIKVSNEDSYRLPVREKIAIAKLNTKSHWR